MRDLEQLKKMDDLRHEEFVVKMQAQGTRGIWLDEYIHSHAAGFGGGLVRELFDELIY